MEIQLSEHFNYKKLLKFTFPSIIMMIFTSIYGEVSAIISFLRTLVFQVAAVLVLPIFFELDGIGISIVVAELLAVVLGVIFLAALRKKYRY